jgi:DNA-binding response OmpR family regulator
MGVRVLAVDPDPDDLRLIGLKLRQAGFEVLTALDGERGLALVLSSRPEVLLTEVMLPGRDGLSVVAEARRQLGPAAPVAILLSQNGEEADVVAGLRAGADDYIVKPFSPRELIARITVARVRAGRLPTSVADDSPAAEVEA